jgi:hypothetical protein
MSRIYFGNKPSVTIGAIAGSSSITMSGSAKIAGIGNITAKGSISILCNNAILTGIGNITSINSAITFISTIANIIGCGSMSANSNITFTTDTNIGESVDISGESTITFTVTGRINRAPMIYRWLDNKWRVIH